MLHSESLGWSCISQSSYPYAFEHFQLHGQGQTPSCIISHTGDWLHEPPIASVGLRLSDVCVWYHTPVCVVKQSVHEDSMAWHVAEVVRDISGTVSSMTSYGGLSKEHKCQV